MTHYTQCKLKNSATNVITVSWIPKKFAVKGRFLRLKDNGTWTDGWEVIEVWTTKPEDQVLPYRDDYRSWREVTDV